MERSKDRIDGKKEGQDGWKGEGRIDGNKEGQDRLKG
jgi:hypothetical protein